MFFPVFFNCNTCTFPFGISSVLDGQQYSYNGSTIRHYEENYCENLSIMDLKKILPADGPPVEEVLKYVEKYKNEIIVIKYGGNVFIDRKIFDNFIKDLSVLNKLGLQVVVVHGGGPRIKKELSKQNIESKFVRGLRVTDEKIINIVETVLIDFNEDIVNSLKKIGSRAASLHTKKDNVIEIIPEQKELGFVGIPDKINTDTIFGKLKNNIIPIISPLG